MSIDLNIESEKEDRISKQEIENRKNRELAASKRVHEITEKVEDF